MHTVQQIKMGKNEGNSNAYRDAEMVFLLTKNHNLIRVFLRELCLYICLCFFSMVSLSSLSRYEFVRWFFFPKKKLIIHVYIILTQKVLASSVASFFRKPLHRRGEACEHLLGLLFAACCLSLSTLAESTFFLFHPNHDLFLHEFFVVRASDK